MRELLFRGQTRRKGEKVRLDGTPIDSNWVYGGVAQLNEERAMIYQTEPDFQKFAVYADTVGQYTGLTDKNGRKIFEGDIVKLHRDGFGYDTATVVYKQNGFYAVSHSYWGCYDFSGGETADFGMGASGYVTIKIEVIGNIHDNGELLK